MTINDEELMLENCKASWRGEAHERALQEVKGEGLTGEKADALYDERKAYHYAELERLGMENIQKI